VCLGNQSHASIVTDPGLLQLYELRDFHIRGVQLFELLDVAGPHPHLVEGTVIRERMLVAPARPEEDEHTEKHELVPHDSIVSGATGKARKCAVRDTRRKDRSPKLGEWPTGKRNFQPN
jgi:hypothetical protein